MLFKFIYWLMYLFFFLFFSFLRKYWLMYLDKHLGLFPSKKKKTFGLIKYVDFKFDVDKH